MLIDTTLGFAALSLTCMLAAIICIMRNIMHGKRSNPRIPTLISVVGAILYGLFLSQMDVADDQMCMFPLFAFLLCAAIAKITHKAQQKERRDNFRRECSDARAESQVIYE